MLAAGHFKTVKRSNDIISVVTRKNDINGSLLVIILCLAQKKVKSEAMVLFHWKNLFYSLAVAPTKASFQVFSLSRQKYHSKTVKGTIGIVSEFKNDAWRQVGTLKQPRYGHSAIIFNNLIYVIGGKGNVFDQKWYFRSTSGQASGQAGTILSMCWKRIKAFDHLKPKSGNQMTIGLNSKLLLSDQNWKITRHIPSYLF